MYKKTILAVAVATILSACGGGSGGGDNNSGGGNGGTTSPVLSFNVEGAKAFSTGGNLSVKGYGYTATKINEDGSQEAVVTEPEIILTNLTVMAGKIFISIIEDWADRPEGVENQTGTYIVSEDGSYIKLTDDHFSMPIGEVSEGMIAFNNAHIYDVANNHYFKVLEDWDGSVVEATTKDTIVMSAHVGDIHQFMAYNVKTEVVMPLPPISGSYAFSLAEDHLIYAGVEGVSMFVSDMATGDKVGEIQDPLFSAFYGKGRESEYDSGIYATAMTYADKEGFNDWGCYIVHKDRMNVDTTITTKAFPQSFCEYGDRYLQYSNGYLVLNGKSSGVFVFDEKDQSVNEILAGQTIVNTSLSDDGKVFYVKMDDKGKLVAGEYDIKTTEQTDYLEEVKASQIQAF